MWLNPYFWGALVLSWVVVAVSVYEHEETSFNKERAIAQAALEAANKHAQEISDERNAKVADISSRLADTQAKSDKAAKTLRDSISSGAVRLSIPVASCGSVPNDSTAAQGNTEARADIDPGFTQALVSVTQRGDQAINQLNACIDSYNALENK
jgi:hypothetical protein